MVDSGSIEDLTLEGESRVAVAGDWHGRIDWVESILPAVHTVAPDVRTVLHVGDFGISSGARGEGFLSSVDHWCEKSGIQRILVTPGNHENWRWLDQQFASLPGKAIRLSHNAWVLPRGYRFRLAGQTFLSFGGAASLDAARRRISKAWWPTELPTDREVTDAIAGGPADILITHETINGGTPRVEALLEQNPMGWDDEALAYSADSRAMITRVWASVHPRILFHGHLHVADAVRLPSGQRVYSLGANGQTKNVGLLTLADLSWTWLH